MKYTPKHNNTNFNETTITSLNMILVFFMAWMVTNISQWHGLFSDDYLLIQEQEELEGY